MCWERLETFDTEFLVELVISVGLEIETKQTRQLFTLRKAKYFGRKFK